MPRIAVLLVLLGAAVLVAVLWTVNGEKPGPAPVVDRLSGDDAGPALTGRGTEDAASTSAEPGASPGNGNRDGAARRLSAALDRLRGVRAAHAASVATSEEVAAAERDVWLARAEAGEITEPAAYAEIVKLDAAALARTEARFDHGMLSLEAVLMARVRLHLSKRRAGHADERYQALRAEYLLFIERDHQANTEAGARSPTDHHRRVLEVCTEFPLDPGVRDRDLEGAAEALRDALAAELVRLLNRNGGRQAIRAGDPTLGVLLELIDVNLLLGDIGGRQAHLEKWRAYDTVLRDLERQDAGVVPEPRELASVRLRVHREKRILGDSDEDYVRLRHELLRGKRARLDTLVSNGLLGVQEREETLERLEAEFPPVEVLDAVLAED